jgi:hypothetical protein
MLLLFLPTLSFYSSFGCGQDQCNWSIYYKILTWQNDKAKLYHYAVKCENGHTSIKLCIGNGTFELRDGTTSTMEKTQSTRACSKDILGEIVQMLQVSMVQ